MNSSATELQPVNVGPRLAFHKALKNRGRAGRTDDQNPLIVCESTFAKHYGTVLSAYAKHCGPRRHEFSLYDAERHSV